MIKMLKICSLVAAFFFTYLTAGAATYIVQGKIKGHPANKVYLAEFYGDKKTIVDTGYVDKSGNFQFELTDENKTGLYRVAFYKGKFIDIIFNKEDIEFETSYENPFDNLLIKKSEETRVYYEYLARRNLKEYKLDLLKPLVISYPQDDPFFKNVLEQFDYLQKQQRSYTDSILEKMGASYVAKLIKADRLPFIDPLQSNDDRINELRKHFFDETDFNDTDLLASNAIPQKIIAYLTLYTFNDIPKEEQEELFKQAVDTIMQKASVNSEMYKFALEYIVNGFESFNYDKVLDHIVANYTDDEEDNCENEERKNKIQSIIASHKYLQAGTKAPDITLPDRSGIPIELDTINSKYTLVLFWSSMCDHCKEMLPQLDLLYKSELGKKLEIYAIAIDIEDTYWLEAIDEGNYSWINVSDMKGWNSKAVIDYYVYATPTMLLLDKDKNIISKPASVGDIHRTINALENK